MPYDDPDSGLNRPAADLDTLIDQAGPPPWRIPVVASPAVRVVLLGMTPGTLTTPHHHPRAVETFRVVRGIVGLRVATNPEFVVGPGYIVLARPNEVHAIRVPGPDPAVLMCTVTPNENAPDEQIDSPPA